MDKFTVKELRARHEMTQDQVAKKLGISTQTYNAWENNFGKVKVRNADAIARLFNVTLDQIFFDDKLENNSSTLAN